MDVNARLVAVRRAIYKPRTNEYIPRKHNALQWRRLQRELDSMEVNKGDRSLLAIHPQPALLALGTALPRYSGKPGGDRPLDGRIVW